jgi:hypothetical protein
LERVLVSFGSLLEGKDRLLDLVLELEDGLITRLEECALREGLSIEEFVRSALVAEANRLADAPALQQQYP